MNWVEKRQDCNAVNALALLCVEVKENVATRREQLLDSDSVGHKPEFLRLPNGRAGFMVIRNGETVAFEVLGPRTIRVSEDGEESFDVHVHMDQDQRCVMMVGDERLESWQVLYKALDRLLF